MKIYKHFIVSILLLFILFTSTVNATDLEHDLYSSDDLVMYDGEADILMDSGLNNDLSYGSSLKEESSANIYVSPNGNDENDGRTNESPYQTLNKSINSIDNSYENIQNINIYLDEGNFSGEGNRNITIENYTQNISFIGAGYNKTIIDMETFSNAFNIENSTINFINVTFINGLRTGTSVNSPDMEGGAIYINNSRLFCSDCIFENNSAKSDGGAIYINANSSLSLNQCTFIANNGKRGGAINMPSSCFLSIINSKFYNNWANLSGGALHLQSLFDIDNTIFYNNYLNDTKTIMRGGSIFVFTYDDEKSNISNSRFENSYALNGSAIYGSNMNLTNNVFINCSGDEVVVGGDLYLRNNTMLDCNNNGSLINVTGLTNLYVTVCDNQTISINTTTFKLNATVSDDMGNGVVYSGTTNAYKINFTVGNESVGEANLINGFVSGTFDYILENGAYLINISVYNKNYDIFSNESVFKLATAIVDVPIVWNDIYVSAEGNDSNLGTYDSPFKTIAKAISHGFGNSSYLNVHLLEGVFYGDGNLDLTLNHKGYLNIIGAEEKTIINGINASYFINFGYDTGNVNISNLIFTNFSLLVDGNIITFSPTNVEKSSIKILNCTLLNNRFSHFVDSNMDYNHDLLKDSIFINNTIFNAGHIVNFAYVTNCTFINNMGTSLLTYLREINCSYFDGNIINNSAGLGLINFFSNSTSFNNTFINNTCHVNGIFNLINNTVYPEGTYPDGGISGVNLTSINDSFILNKGTNGVVLYGGAQFINDTFTNNTASAKGGVIYYNDSYNLYIENSTFITNYDKDGLNDIYGKGSILDLNIRDIYLIYESVNCSGDIAYLKAIIEDINIDGYTVDFYLNNSYVGTSILNSSVAELTVSNLSTGIYIINETNEGFINMISGILKVDDSNTTIVPTDNDTVNGTDNETGSVVDVDDDTRYIQWLIDNASPGELIDLANETYNIADVNITKDITVIGGIINTIDNSRVFNIVDNVLNVTIANMTINAKDNTVIVCADARNNGYACEISAISINNISVNTSANGANPESVTILKVYSDSKTFNPSNPISVTGNTLTTGVKPFVLENTKWNNKSSIIIPAAGKIKTAIDVDDVEIKKGSVIATLKDTNTNVLAEKEISYTINGIKYNTATDANGQVFISNLSTNATINFVFAGDEAYDGSNATVKYLSPLKTKLAKLLFSNMTTTAIYTPRTGEYFVAKLVDDDGVGIINKTVEIGFNGASYTRVTDENGSFKLQVNLKVAGGYTFAVCFLGDEEYNSSFAVSKITVLKANTTLKNGKSKYAYKANAKTKSISATLKLSNGTVISGKTVKFIVNGKTYSANTNSKGIATVKISLTVKRTYKYTVIFAGTSQLAKSSIIGTLVIK